MATGKRIGYIRVSTVEQNTSRQLDGITLDKVYIDHFTGKKFDRPQLKELLGYIREDDIIFVHSIDRLGRDHKGLIELIDDLKKKGVSIQFIKEGVTITPIPNPMAEMFIHIISSIAQYDIARKREAILEGIAIAKREGRYKVGRPKVNDRKLELLKKEMEEPALTRTRSKAQIAKDLGMSRATYYKYLKEVKQQQQIQC